MRNAREWDRPSATRAVRVPARLRQALPLLAWLAALVVGIVVFTALGSGPLAAPPVTAPSTWGRWAAAREPVVATVAVLRLVVLALAWYLVGVTTVGAVARLARTASLVRLADTLSVPLVRRVLQTSLGVGLATAVVTASAPGLVPPRPAPTAVSPAAVPARDALDVPGMRPVDASPTMRALDRDDGGPAMRPLAGADPAPPGMRPLAPTGPAAPTDPVEAPTASTAAPADAHGPDVTAADTWTARSGDHLWAIAEAHLHDVLATTPSDTVVATYWRRLVQANRGRLVDPDDPDLIVPGQRFVLPDVEVAG